MIFTADLGQSMPVLGVEGQLLGHASRCLIDAYTMHIIALLVSTPWQDVEIPSANLRFAGEQHAFKVRPTGCRGT